MGTKLGSVMNWGCNLSAIYIYSTTIPMYKYSIKIHRAKVNRLSIKRSSPFYYYYLNTGKHQLDMCDSYEVKGHQRFRTQQENFDRLAPLE